MFKTDVLPEIQEDTTEADGKAHLVRIKSLLAGGPVVALCGKKYVPTIVGASVMDRPQCSVCVELFELLKAWD